MKKIDAEIQERFNVILERGKWVDEDTEWFKTLSLQGMVDVFSLTTKSRNIEIISAWHRSPMSKRIAYAMKSAGLWALKHYNVDLSQFDSMGNHLDMLKDGVE